MFDKLQFVAGSRHSSTAESPDKLKFVEHLWIRQQYPWRRKIRSLGNARGPRVGALVACVKNHGGHGDHGNKSSGAMIFHYLLPVRPVTPVVFLSVHTIEIRSIY